MTKIDILKAIAMLDVPPDTEVSVETDRNIYTNIKISRESVAGKSVIFITAISDDIAARGRSYSPDAS